MQAVEAMKAPLGSLRDLLHDHISRVDEDRPPWNLHASSITYEDEPFCARYPVLMKYHGLKLPTQKVSTSMAVTWDWGRMVERRVIDWFGDIGIAWGDWQCEHRGCRKVHPWQYKPKLCVACGGAAFKYVESRATSTYSGASSGLDLLLRMPGRPHLVFAEVKSIDKEKFKELLAPLAEHRARTQLSLRNISEADNALIREQVDDQVAFVLYVSKGGYGVKTPKVEGGFTPFKEWQITRNDGAIEKYVEASRSAFLALKGEGPMPPRICGHFSDKRAQYCAALTKCFDCPSKS